MIRAFVVVLALFALGCGSGISVDIHHVTQDELDTMHRGAMGHSKWSDDGEQCDIYIKRIEEYTGEDQYMWVLGHELRHCFEGHFHD